MTPARWDIRKEGHTRPFVRKEERMLKPSRYTKPLKVRGIRDYGYADKRLSSYEEDHLVPLAVGGSPRSPKNLWPERYAGKWGARARDKLERFLQRRVCDGAIRLSTARRAFRD